MVGAPPARASSRVSSTPAFPLVLSVLLFQFIGFQYSAYIAGEVRGNVRRGVLIALLGALLIGVLANSVYVDAISSHFGFDTNVSWGASYWGLPHSIAPLPLGQPNAMPLLAVIANKSLWPIWALITLGGTIFPFLLCPVYINFISRMQLAWSLDRQMPEWFGRVNERLRAPLNAILATLGLTALFLFFQSYKDLPTFLATSDHKLNLAGTAWFSIVMALFTWSLPGVNAMLVRWPRPDLVRNAPFGSTLPWIGLAWIVFPLWIYIFAVIKPIVNALKAGGALTYLETNGIIDAGCFYLIGLIIFFIMRFRARRGRRGREDAVHRAAPGLRRTPPLPIWPPASTSRRTCTPPRRPGASSSTRSSSTSTRPTWRCWPATSPARRSSRWWRRTPPTPGGAMRPTCSACTAPPVAMTSWRRCSATSPTWATTRSSPPPRRPSGSRATSPPAISCCTG